MNPKPASQRDRLLDLGVFAPLGFLIQRDDVVHDLAQAGRRQVAFTRSLGRVALKGFVASARAAQPKRDNSAAPVPAQAPTTAEIANFDELTAREIIALVPTSTAAELRWMQSQEKAGKGRVTVLRAISNKL